MTTAAWVRRALRSARRGKPHATSRKKLDAIEAAMVNAFPAPSVEHMLEEIERDYIGERSR
jgi:hypothetical protein